MPKGVGCVCTCADAELGHVSLGTVMSAECQSGLVLKRKSNCNKDQKFCKHFYSCIKIMMLSEKGNLSENLKNWTCLAIFTCENVG